METNLVTTAPADVNTIANGLLSLSPGALLLVVLIGVGRLLKAWGMFPDKHIPAALFVLGGLGWSMLNTAAWTPTVLLQGFGFGLAAVGVHQLFKQNVDAAPAAPTPPVANN